MTAIAPLAFRLSKAVLSTASPPIPQAYKWATEYQGSIGPLLDMSQGVPGVLPSLAVRSAIGAAASSPEGFGYGLSEGDLSLRRALAQEMKVVYGPKTDVTEDDLALTAGCNMAFVAAVMVVAEPGDEILLPTPWYFNHQMTLNLLGVKPVPLPSKPEDGFAPNVEKCRALITPKTKAISLVTPNNPTGAVYPPALIQSFAILAQELNIALIVDETYRDFITSGAPHSLFETSWRSTFIHLFSFSKSYCLPGHRLGAICASPLVVNEVKTVLDCLQICPPRPVQIALAPLLPSLRENIQVTARAIEKRHELLKELLPKGWVIESQGGYFAFVRHPFGNMKGIEVSRRLAAEMGVLTLPSSFFMGNDVIEDEDRWIRFSVANVDDEKVRRVCERLGVFSKHLG